MFSPIWGKGNGRGISRFAVNRGTVYRGFTVLSYYISSIKFHILTLHTHRALTYCRVVQYDYIICYSMLMMIVSALCNLVKCKIP